MNHKTTVVVTYYNTPEHLMERCMNSIINCNLGYVIVNDGSNSEFTPVLSKYDNVIHLGKNVGLYKAFKIGLDSVTTPYVTKADSDDVMLRPPMIDEEHDAFVNSLDGMISLKLDDFIKRPYAGLSGITAKTEVLKSVWYQGVECMGDIIIFSRLLRDYKLKMNELETYRYIPRKGNSMTNISDELRETYKSNTLKIVMQELNSGVYV